MIRANAAILMAILLSCALMSGCGGGGTTTGGGGGGGGGNTTAAPTVTTSTQNGAQDGAVIVGLASPTADAAIYYTVDEARRLFHHSRIWGRFWWRRT